YSGLAFRATEPDVLLMAGHSFSTGSDGAASIYAVGVTRDAQGHINGFAPRARLVSAAPGVDGDATTGLAYNGVGSGISIGPGSRVVYISPRDSTLGVLAAGQKTPAQLIDLRTLEPTALPGIEAMLRLPQTFSGAGRLKLGNSSTGDLYDINLAPDGSGSGDLKVTSVAAAGTLTGIGSFFHQDTPDPVTGDPRSHTNVNQLTGLLAVAHGSPQFDHDALLSVSCDYNTGEDSNLVAYDVDSAGNPVAGSDRVVVSQLCATGATVDPVSGDLLFTNFYGFPSLTVIRGFSAPLPSAQFVRNSFNVAESGGSATITVERIGDNSSALAVDYSTAAGTAASGMNYQDVSGTLNWSAGDAAKKTFTVPVMSDHLYNGSLTVALTLAPENGGTPSQATLHIANEDPRPVVTLTSADRDVDESAGAIDITVAVSPLSGQSIKLPLRFSGTAQRNRDFTLDQNLSGQPVNYIVIPPGSDGSGLTLPIHITDDVMHEDDETLTVTLQPTFNADTGSVTSNTITIHDNDALPSAGFAAASSTVKEGSRGGGVAVPAALIRLSAPSSTDVSVPVTLVGGGLDPRITLVSPVIIPAGRLSAYAVLVADDGAKEAPVQLTLSIGAPTGATQGSQSTQVLTVKDLD
ncbi:MAG TPA: Calx-beta domain-containing protein, partial [Nevskiaceae bacterium]|nr:Calx-beta domain-containing protein [Nevskiaceae bacterium]